MRRWCQRTPESRVSPGNFLEARVLPAAGRILHEDQDFLAELASRVMLRYEGENAPPLLVLDEGLLDRPERTRKFYRRLFEPGGMPTAEFITEASETIAVWIEESLDDVLVAVGNPPHGAEPGFDAVSVLRDQDGIPRLRLVQVKATLRQLQQNCNLALEGFRRLESGDHDPQLFNRLKLLAACGRLPAEVVVRDLLYDAQRRYRVTALHLENRDTLGLMTTYDQKVSGQVVRRSAYLFQIDPWDQFWISLARVVCAQLN